MSLGQGDSFGAGFLSGGFSSLAGNDIILATLAGGTASRLAGGKFINGAVSSAAAATAMGALSGGFTFQRTLDVAGKIWDGAKWMGSTIQFGAKIMAADMAALGVGQTYGNYTVAKADVFGLFRNITSLNLKGTALSLFKTIHHTIIPKYGFYGGAGYGVEQFGTDGTPNPLNRQDWSNWRHDQHGRHFEWVKDSWSGNNAYLPAGPFGQIYKVLGTGPFSLAGGLQEIGVLP